MDYCKLFKNMSLVNIIKRCAGVDEDTTDFTDALHDYCCDNVPDSEEIFECLRLTTSADIRNTLSTFIDVCDKTIHDRILAHASRIDWRAVSSSICDQICEDDMVQVAEFVNRFYGYIDWNVIAFELGLFSQFEPLYIAAGNLINWKEFHNCDYAMALKYADRLNWPLISAESRVFNEMTEAQFATISHLVSWKDLHTNSSLEVGFIETHFDKFTDYHEMYENDVSFPRIQFLVKNSTRIPLSILKYLGKKEKKALMEALV